MVDPLDGTSNFAAGLPWFGVIIAYFEENIPVLGGMYLPVDGSFTWLKRVREPVETVMQLNTTAGTRAGKHIDRLFLRLQ